MAAELAARGVTMRHLISWLKAEGRFIGSLVRWGLVPFHELRRDRRPGVVILLYHRIGGHTRSAIDMTAGVFEQQMRHLHLRHRVISLDEMAEICAQGSIQGSTRDIVAVTFDDGYVETYSVAFPILQRYAIPATIYLPARYVEERRPFDFGAYRAMAAAQRPRPLSWNQAAEMVHSGLISIGGHTNTHADLSGTPARDARRELEDCDRLIESRLGLRPRHFAYPWGRWSTDTHELVAARYETVVLGGPGKNPVAELDLSRLWRYPVVQSDGYRLFQARLRSLPVYRGGRRGQSAPRGAQESQTG